MQKRFGDFIFQAFLVSIGINKNPNKQCEKLGTPFQGFDNFVKPAQCVFCIVRVLVRLLKSKRLLSQHLKG